jgi:hypothetical protein
MKTLVLVAWFAAAVLVVPGLACADVPAARCEGKPSFSEGKALGYFVWKDGDTWKIRWTTFGERHRFNGRVAVEGGDLVSFKRIDVDEEHKVVAPGRPGHVVHGPKGRVVGVNPGRSPVVLSRDEDRIEQADERTLRFNTFTDADIDGIDFKVTKTAERIRLFLEINGVARPQEVEVGRSNLKPGETPLVIALERTAR